MRVLITGGAGFIGSNAARRFMGLGHSVTLLDNLSRPGARANLEWLRSAGSFETMQVDVKDAQQLCACLRNNHYDVIVHLAGQVAVTTSLKDPRADFEANALGTLNVLEAIRVESPASMLLNASTNKVYGKLAALAVRESDTRYELVDLPHGVAEEQPLDFHSPYGCSKGVAEQYVLDYARLFGLRAVSLRQSCIYGPRQFGLEDQGWLAWFTLCHLRRRPVTIYGTGKQVRDGLFVDDLLDCYLAALARMDQVAGQVFNVGGGPERTLSLLELMRRLEDLSGRPVDHSFHEWRPGDQPVYVSDIRKAAASLAWAPCVSIDQGLRRLYEWVASNLDAFPTPAA